MSRFLPYLLIVSAIGLTLAGGILHGRLSHRWGPSDQAEAAGRRLAEFPDQVGDWTTRDRSELSTRTVDMLQCTGYVNRTYINHATGEIVNLAVVVGPPGSISVHVPELCYNSTYYKTVQKRRAVKARDAAGENVESWAMTFESTRVDKTTLRVHMALGMLSLVLAVAIIYSGSVVAFDFYHAGSKVEILSPDGLLVANLMNLFGFFVCFTAGIAKRKKPELHKRFLTLAGVVMIGPAAFRLVVNCGLAPPFSLLVQFGFVAAMFAYDRRRLRRTSPATWIAAGLIVLLIAVTLAVG